ncbi:hypothetical protein [Marinobacterium litorale]|uniref:hypothetical protein n=1 Tax=Marinobacterium litorale TaxID=404770 RepID=UPI000481B924|nr:hypothetical protein [Marinobacterium litorale]
MSDIEICEQVRDAKTGEWIDLFGNGHFYGMVTSRYTYLPHEPMGPVYRDVAWVDPPFGPPSTTNSHRNFGLCVYRTRHEMKAHLGESVHVEAYRIA